MGHQSRLLELKRWADITDTNSLSLAGFIEDTKNLELHLELYK